MTTTESQPKRSMGRRCSGGHGRPLLYLLLLACSWVAAAQAQAQQAPRTDPVEVGALNAILGRWGKKAPSAWNISSEPCSGAAVDQTDIDNSPTINPGIKCDCSFNNRTVCHITKPRVLLVECCRSDTCRAGESHISS